jgi:hypothetical protein
MMQRWSDHMTEPLRTFMRRGALFLLGTAAAITITLSPLVSRPAAAAITDFGLGGNSCAIETVGWVICPTMRTIARLADKGFTYINQSTLSIDYTLFGNNGKTFQGWEVMRNIANALFVIVFLYIIYGYLIGRTNGTYSLKRLLPRLLIAVIAVNFSYYFGVLFIDVSNIVGDAIWTILKNIYGSGSPVMPLGATANPLSDGNLTKMTAAAMGNTGMVWVLMPLLAAVDISVALISAAAVILIIMREAIVAGLILAAPVLIVLYLLPNMERFSSQAGRLFLQLLTLYPIIALLLGVGQIVSLAAGGWDNQSAPYGGGTGNIVPDAVAAAAAVVPLLGVWFLFKNLSSLMSAAGSRLSATVAGRRGGKDEEKARVTGKATAGAAGAKNAAGINNPLNRRQAFSRNRRRRSLGGSALPGDLGEQGIPTPAIPARQPAGNNAALENSIRGNADEDATKRLEDLQNARIEGEANDMSVEDAAIAAAAAEQQNGKAEDKPKTAKDIFNNLNRSHESKDKDRKFNAGPAPAGGGEQAGGAPQPQAPSTSYRAPSLAQNNNIISGGSASPPATTIVVAPVQVDSSALLGGQNQPQHRPPDNVTQPPISGTEEKAKARAQKYLFDADKDLEDARDKVDILGQNHHDAPDEAPHTTTHDDKDKKDDK